tara:strand:+ start:2058 stop:2777 length:720 start_codon:yes stop_codon:yes gene_type:complete
MIKYKEILQEGEKGLKLDDNNSESCPGFSWIDSIKWIDERPTAYASLAKTLVNTFPDAKSILELGCGPGCLSYYIKHYGDDVEIVTLDINADAPLRSPFIGENHFLCYTDKPYQIQKDNKDVKFDLIISYEHFEHIPPKNLGEFLNNIKKHCHENTIINCTASTAETKGIKWLSKDQDVSKVGINDFASHQSVFYRHQWADILDKSGFELLEDTYITESNIPPNFRLQATVELTFKLKK